MTGSVYEKYTLFGETFGALREDFQVQLEAAKKSANTCTVIIFIVILQQDLRLPLFQQSSER